MESTSANTEQMILAAAEKIFIKKGYTGTRCVEIAQAAGINHALLHYYFRTKEHLFNQIFEQKASLLLDFFVTAFDKDLPFFEKLKIGIKKHFDFIAQTPELPFFVLRELIQDKDKKAVIIQKVAPVGKDIMRKMKQAIDAEVAKGTIRFIRPRDLLLNIVSLNVFSFVALQILFDTQQESETEKFKTFLEERKKNNVDVIINSLKIQ
jgi:AcrR family transcriptional regulator